MNTELKAARQLHGFARRLVAEGLMDEQAAAEAGVQASKSGKTILAWLIKNNSVDPEALTLAASVEYGVPIIDIRAIDLSIAPISLVNERLIEKHNTFPLYLRGNTLFLAVSDPTDQEVIDAVSFSSGFRVEPVLVALNHLVDAIEKAMNAAEPVFDDFEDEGLEDLGYQLGDDNLDEDLSDPSVDEAPVVKFINKVLMDGIRKGASDIHFEPYETSYRIRYRLDGILIQAASPPIQMSRRLSSRLKVMAGLDIAEKRVPQDGRIKLNITRKKAIDF
ncbi:ATPase, T2SS/T4P/T4SS family, partial [Pseudomonadota bacterium]